MSLGNSITFNGAVKPTAIEKDGYDTNLSAHRYVEIPSGLKWRFDYTGRSDGQAVYQGFAPSGLGEGEDGWLIYKYTYDDDGYLTQRNVYGAGADENANWTDRGTYTYA